MWTVEGAVASKAVEVYCAYAAQLKIMIPAIQTVWFLNVRLPKSMCLKKNIESLPRNKSNLRKYTTPSYNQVIYSECTQYCSLVLDILNIFSC